MNIICKISGHKIQSTGSCEEICVRCGYRNAFHRYNGCKCETCGKSRGDHHTFLFVAREPVYGKCSRLGASDIYNCSYCNEDCDHVKTGETISFKCKTCGMITSMDSAGYNRRFRTESNRKANKKEDFSGGNSYEIVW